MAEIPAHIQAVQASFRDKMEKQSRDFDSLAMKALAEEVNTAEVVQELSAGDMLEALEDETSAR
jgi:hypothetical protein